MNRSWNVLARERVIDGPWLKVERQRVALPNGHEIDDFYVISSRSWASVLAMTDDGKVVLVEQYRHGVMAISRELPAGVIEPDETPLHAAQRELREETGYVSERWSELCVLSPEPTRHTAAAHFFVAQNARLVSEPKLDASEDISVSTVDPAELLADVRAGRIVHAAHVAAILLAQERGFWSLHDDRER